MKSGEVATSEECLTYTVPQAGKLLGLKKNRAYEAASRGEMPVIRIGKLLKVPKAALHQMLDQARLAKPAA